MRTGSFLCLWNMLGFPEDEPEGGRQRPGWKRPCCQEGGMLVRAGEGARWAGPWAQKAHLPRPDSGD